jgi:glutamate racemase
MQSAPIGIFDSGLGGLTVAKAIHELLPKESLLYYGDTLHLPYGEKSETHIIEYSERIVRFLLKQEVKLIVIACNSASANAASYLRKKYHDQIEIRGVIRPMLAAIANQNYQKVGLIGTQATIKSAIYPKILAEYNQKMSLECMATPLLVPMIEEGFNTNKISEEIIKEYLQKFEPIDALLLACTHYPLIQESVASFFEDKIKVYNNAQYMAEDVRAYLQRNDLLENKNQKPKHSFLVSDYTETFANSASMFFGKEILVEEHNIFTN